MTIKPLLFQAQTDWDRALLRMLWKAWQERPSQYTDATGVSMAMDIDTQFAKALAGEERSGIPTVKVEGPQPYITSREFVEVNVADYYGPAMHRMRLSMDQARMLQSALNEFFEGVNHTAKLISGGSL